MEDRPYELTAAERAELEEEARVLVAKFVRLLQRQRRAPNCNDSGDMGVAHADFLIGWDGVRLKPPPFS
jgi:hypothetical protein